MYSSLKYIKCYPGGNTTIIILSEVNRMHQKCIAKWILKNHIDIEQVAFLEKPTNNGAMGRLQMAGGEFCGNAARCLAYYIAQRDYSNRLDKVSFLLEVSGANSLLEATVAKTMVSIDVPVKNLDVVKKVSEKITIVYLDGITHILIKGYPPRNAKVASWTWINRFNLRNNCCVGVVYYYPTKNGIEISPVVWVRDINELIQETSCGSASISLSLSLVLNSGITQAKIYQPSGKIIYTLIKHQKGVITKASIRGCVRILEEGCYTPTITIP